MTGRAVTRRADRVETGRARDDEQTARAFEPIDRTVLHPGARRRVLHAMERTVEAGTATRLAGELYEAPWGRSYRHPMRSPIDRRRTVEWDFRSRRDINIARSAARAPTSESYRAPPHGASSAGATTQPAPDL